MVDQDIPMAITFFSILFLSFVVNMTFIVVVCRRRRLQNCHYFLASSLALVDVIIAGTWTGLSAVASLEGWDVPGEVCQLQFFLQTLTQMLTAYTLASVGVERLLKMAAPSRHAVIYLPKLTMCMILALLIFCGVISSIHLYGYVPVKWISKLRQCGPHVTQSIRSLALTFCYDYAIPYWVFGLPAFMFAYIKIYLAKRKSRASGAIVLERNTYISKDFRMCKPQVHFLPELNPSTENGGKDTFSKQAYKLTGYIEPEYMDSDVGDLSKSPDDTRQSSTILTCLEYKTLLASSLATVVTAMMWLPWVILRLLWNHSPGQSVSDWLTLLCIVLIHSSALVKPLVYFTANPYFRSAVIKTLCSC